MAPIPDPADVPDLKQSMSMGTLQMSKVQVHGISQFRLKFITTDVKEMEARCGIQFDALRLMGNYSIKSLVARSQGKKRNVISSCFVQNNMSFICYQVHLQSH